MDGWVTEEPNVQNTKDKEYFITNKMFQIERLWTSGIKNFIKKRLSATYERGYKDGYEQCKFDTLEGIKAIPQEELDKTLPYKEKWQKGYDCGYEDGYKQGQSDGFTDAYEAGQLAAWNTILAIGGHANNEIKRIFDLGNVVDPIFAVVKKYTPNEAMEIIKAYEDKPKPKTNADKFVEVFGVTDLQGVPDGFGTDVIGKAKEWWNEPYVVTTITREE